MKKRYYVGIKPNSKPELIKTAIPITPEFSKEYFMIIGPFITKNGAIACRDSNPQVYSVIEGEWLAKIHK